MSLLCLLVAAFLFVCAGFGLHPLHLAWTREIAWGLFFWVLSVLLAGVMPVALPWTRKDQGQSP